MLDQLSNDMLLFIDSLKHHLPLILIILAVLWVINIINWYTGKRLFILGLIPRTFFGLVGIVFSPILHADFNHLFFNSIPFFCLSLLIASQNIVLFYVVTIIVTFLGGFVVWCIGRKANHIGASGVISGYFGYILITAYQQPTITSIILGVITLYYFGGILFSVLPLQDRVSWEAHLIGLLSGFAAYPICDHLFGLV